MMKPSFCTPLAIQLFITILFLQQITFADAQKGEIESVCAHTEAPHLCISILRSADPCCSIGDKLRKYCVIFLEKVLSKAEGLKSICPKAYKKLVEDVEEAIEKLKSEQPVEMVVENVESAISDVVSCPGHGVSLLKLLRIVLRILKTIK